MKISIYNLQRALLYSFVFFGPLGVILSPPFLPNAFRFYYFFLPLFPIFFLRLKESAWKAILTFIPFFFYCIVFAYFTENKSVPQEVQPLFRSGLFITQYLFTFGAAFCVNACAQEKRRILCLYLTGFFLSLVVGYTLFWGNYLGFVPMKTISRLCIELQTEKQVTEIFWRFSPGSYPNEYGNVSSFVLSVLILLLAERKNFSLFLYLFICMAFVSLIFSTTRAAYLSFCVTLIYLCLISLPVRRIFLKLVCLGGCIVFILMRFFSFDFLHTLVQRFGHISLKTGSSGVRIAEWIKGFNQLGHTPLWGTGFGHNIFAHNVYLELLYEMGVIGCMLLLISFIHYFSEHYLQIRKKFFAQTDKREVLYNRITVIGLIHVLLFAITNHNMHHHLTWTIFFFFNMGLVSKKKTFIPNCCY